MIRYTDQDERRTFEETVDLDLGVYWKLTTVERKEVHDIHQRLVEIRDVFRKWTSTTGALRRVTPEEDRAEVERRREAIRTHAATVRANPEK